LRSKNQKSNKKKKINVLCCGWPIHDMADSIGRGTKKKPSEESFRMAWGGGTEEGVRPCQ